ncbi:MAG: DUF58 domain-containing protein [Christensenellales bacterium]|jgi:uncharacterized protein (DUF58 family)
MNARLTAYILFTLAMLISGLSTGAQAYYLVAFALAGLLVLSAASTLWALFTVKIDMKGLKSRVERGESLMTIFTVTHASLLPVASIRLKLSVPSAFRPAQEISVSTLPFVKRTFRYRIVCPHRGVYEAGVTRILASDLFGLVTLSRKSDMRLIRVDVYPRVPDVSPMELKPGDIGPEMISRAVEDTASPSDIRKWQDGDALKKVHWKLTMRKRELMVRVFEESARPDTLIIPDLTEVSAMRDQALTIEDCVCEACAGVAKAQLSAGYPVRMPLTSKRPSEISGQFPPDYMAFVDALMRVTFDSPYEYEQVLMLMMQRMQRTGGAAIVTPRLTTRIADIAVRMQRSGVVTRVIWVTDTQLSQSLELSERLRMEHVLVERINPWSEFHAIEVD